MSMEEDQPWELIDELMAEVIPPQDVPPQVNPEMTGTKSPDEVPLGHGPTPPQRQQSRSKRHHHEHEGSSKFGVQTTSVIAEKPEQPTDKVLKSEGERFSRTDFALRAEQAFQQTSFHTTSRFVERFGSMPPSTNAYDLQPRPARARDDGDVDPRRPLTATFPTPAEKDTVELKLWRENAELRQALQDERNRAQQARQTTEDFHNYARSNTVATQDKEAFAEMNIKLHSEIAKLKTELDDARSHIFSLQPYRQKLTPKEVEQDFDDLVTSISEWVQKFIEPTIDNEKAFQQAVERARKDPEDVVILKQYMGCHPDLIHGCLYPETDVDIIVSIILRFISEFVFQSGIPGNVKHLGEAISQIEASMQSHVEPKRDQFALRTWKAEAFNAILFSPAYKSERSAWRKHLVVDLAKGFKLFRTEKEFVPFCISCQDAVIEPAIRLHEKLLTSTHHFYLDTNPYIISNQQRGLEMNPEFFENLDNLQCENILQNRKHFNAIKLDPSPTFEELKETLTNVLTVVPGMYMRQIGKGDAIKPPVVVRKQQVLVAFGSQEKRDRFLCKGQRTLMNYIYFGHKEKEKEREESRLGAWAKITWG
ncbi:hypothetical protein GE09DRAFT_1278750 [Coniochaeta sp. 2T2.1]|nr:hypothetical protein GE09DRAFT_1278750 [Coniochaeta sp. 2T2.1]